MERQLEGSGEDGQMVAAFEAKYSRLKSRYRVSTAAPSSLTGLALHIHYTILGCPGFVAATTHPQPHIQVPACIPLCVRFCIMSLAGASGELAGGG